LDLGDVPVSDSISDFPQMLLLPPELMPAKALLPNSTDLLSAANMTSYCSYQLLKGGKNKKEKKKKNPQLI